MYWPSRLPSNIRRTMACADRSSQDGNTASSKIAVSVPFDQEMVRIPRDTPDYAQEFYSDRTNYDSSVVMSEAAMSVPSDRA